jgi:II/X family phage/plasmid replication protein
MKTSGNKSQVGNIHIDHITVSGPLDHAHLGEGFYKAVDDHSTVLVGASALRPKGKSSSDDIYVRSKEVQENGRANRLEIICCPPKQLQGHNFFGHADMLDYTYAMFDRQTKKHKLYVDPGQREEWRTGQVGLTQTHLTGNFWCPPSAKPAIFNAVDQNNPKGKHRDIETCISLGFAEKRRSLSHMVTLYDKGVLLEREWKKPEKYQLKLQKLGYFSLRVELKLYSQWLKTNEKGYVMRWKGVDVDALFFKILKTYNIANSIQMLLSEDQLAVLTNSERRAYLLWLNGEDLTKHFSRTTVWKYNSVILEKVGMDMRGSRRPEPQPLINLAEILVPENIVPIPKGAVGSKYYWAPGTAFGDDNLDELAY